MMPAGSEDGYGWLTSIDCPERRLTALSGCHEREENMREMKSRAKVKEGDSISWKKSIKDDKVLFIFLFGGSAKIYSFFFMKMKEVFFFALQNNRSL